MCCGHYGQNYQISIKKHSRAQLMVRLKNNVFPNSVCVFLGGNGLFDDSLASKTTKEEMESQLLELIKRHCPEKSCPLAGSSIYVDREVVRLRMPSVYNYLHYRIVDVSSFNGMVERWSTPEKWAEKEAIRMAAKHIELCMMLNDQ
jgi:oligoribonuclease (3'-5' exoribonuclease)